MRAGLGTSLRLDVAEAAEEAVLQARRRIGGRRPTAAIVVATAAWGARALVDGVAKVQSLVGDAAIAGGSVDALLAGEGRVSHRPALAVLLLCGMDAFALHAETAAGHEARVGPEWAAMLGGPPQPGDALVLFVDALALDADALLDGLARALPGLPVVGMGASELPGERARVWAGDEVAHSACAGLVVRGRRPPGIAVTRGCRLLGGPVEVTRVGGHWVHGLAGRPALDVLRELGLRVGAGGRVEEPACLVGLLDPGAAPPAAGSGDRPLRRIVGIDEERGAIALPEAVASGTGLVLLAPDPEAAARDIADGLAEACAAATGPPVCALHLGSGDSGDLLLEAAVRSPALASRLGGAPLLGLSAAYPIAPAADPAAPAAAHAHSGVIALLG
jgi:small ligand-binding sensory domain FIST